VEWSYSKEANYQVLNKNFMQNQYQKHSKFPEAGKSKMEVKHGLVNEEELVSSAILFIIISWNFNYFFLRFFTKIFYVLEGERENALTF
jgi:hypothetical protein